MCAKVLHDHLSYLPIFDKPLQSVALLCFFVLRGALPVMGCMKVMFLVTHAIFATLCTCKINLPTYMNHIINF